MARKFEMRQFSVTADVVPVATPGGDYLFISEVSGSVTVKFFQGDDIIGEATITQDWEFNFQNGIFEDARAFTKAEVSAASATAVKVTVSEGVNASVKSSTVSLSSVDNEYSPAAVSKTDGQTLVIAAREGRKSLLVQNLPSTASGNNLVWTGGAATQGICLVQGAVAVFDNYEGALTLYSQGSTDIGYQEIY